LPKSFRQKKRARDRARFSSGRARLGRSGQSPLNSTWSTEAEGAWTGTTPERAGAMPRPLKATAGAPDELPVLRVTFARVNGSRFSTLKVVIPGARFTAFTVT